MYLTTVVSGRVKHNVPGFTASLEPRPMTVIAGAEDWRRRIYDALTHLPEDTKISIVIEHHEG